MRIRDGRASVSVRCGRMSHTSTANPVANPQDVCPTVHQMWMGRGLKVGYESENLPVVVVRFCVLAIGTKDAGRDECSTVLSSITARAVSGY